MAPVPPLPLRQPTPPTATVASVWKLLPANVSGVIALFLAVVGVTPVSVNIPDSAALFLVLAPLARLLS